MNAADYNAKQLKAGRLNWGHISQAVKLYQMAKGLAPDGKAGPATIESMRRPEFLGEGNAEARVKRARSAVGHGTKYKLGAGGWHPEDIRPTRDGKCDCSGFISFVIGLKRRQEFGRHKWISTSDIWRDATGEQWLFMQIEEPVAGCLVVYPDSGTKQGHVGIITEVDGDAITGIDCSSSQSKKGDAITERNLRFFTRKASTIYCIPRRRA